MPTQLHTHTKTADKIFENFGTNCMLLFGAKASQAKPSTNLANNETFARSSGDSLRQNTAFCNFEVICYGKTSMCKFPQFLQFQQSSCDRLMSSPTQPLKGRYISISIQPVFVFLDMFLRLFSWWLWSLAIEIIEETTC